MRVTALKEFPYSPNGVSIIQIRKGQDFDCRDDIVGGLLHEGYVKADNAAPSSPPPREPTAFVPPPPGAPPMVADPPKPKRRRSRKSPPK